MTFSSKDSGVQRLKIVSLVFCECVAKSLKVANRAGTKVTMTLDLSNSIGSSIELL